MGKLRLAKSRDSRTRGKAKTPVPSEEALRLKQQIENGYAGFIDYLLGKGYSSATIDRYVREAANFEAWTRQENVPIESVSYADILHYIQQNREQVKQKTLGQKVNSIKHYFNFLSISGMVSDNPALQITIRGIKRRTLYQILKKQELENLYHSYASEYAVAENESNKNQNWIKSNRLAVQRNTVIVGLLVYQGLNGKELIRLMERDVKLREGKIFIAGSRKSNERELVLEAVQMVDLMEYMMKTRAEILELTGKESDKLFVSTGTSNRLQNALQILTRQLQAMNSKAVNFNYVRTSVITHWLKIHNLRQTQYMAGHRFVSSTEAYLVNDLDDLQEEIVRFYPIG